MNRKGYGTQTQTTWIAGEADVRPILDANRTDELWRVSVTGANLLLSLSYGTCGSIRLANVRLPFVAYLPGAFSMQAQPLAVGQAARAVPTLTKVWSGGESLVTTVETGALDARVHRVTAITAATVTVDGNAVALAAGESLNTAEPSVVTAGTVLADWII